MIALVVLLVGAMTIGGCTKAPETPAPAPSAPSDKPADQPTTGPQPGGNFAIALAGTADVLDPHVSGARRSHTMCRHLFDTLVSRDFVDQSYKPGLATEWTWNDSYTSVTFKLRQDVKFHDGTPFNAEAVKFSFDRIVDPATMSKAAKNYIGPYESSVVIDEFTVQVNYTKPVSPTAMFDAMAKVHLAPVSPTAARELGVEGFGRNPVGTGPFMFKEWTANNRITFVRNPDYNWAPPIFGHQGPPLLDSITFVELPEAATRVAALERGEVDAIGEVAEESMASIMADSRFGTASEENPGCPIIMWMNTEDDILKDIQVRKALLHAFDQEELVETVYMGLFPPSYGPLAPSTWGYNRKVEQMYPYDQELAGRMLDEAGWTMGSRGVREKNGKPLKIEILDLVDPRRIEFFQAKMAEIGVEVDARIVTSDYLWEVTRTAEGYQMGSTWFGYTDPHILHLLYHSSNVGTGFAISRWNDPILDDKLEKAISIFDRDERQQAYFEIQEYIMDKALMIPFMGRMEHEAYWSYVKGFRLEFEHPVLYEVYFDPAKK